MRKYWVTNYFAHGRFLEVGQKQKTEKKKKKVGENNGQLHFVLHHEWHMQARLDQKQKIQSTNSQE